MPSWVAARIPRMAGEAHVAAMEGRWGDLEDLIRRQPQVASEIRDSRLPLHDAVRQERAPAHILRALIDANPSGVQALTKYGNLPIHLAALVKADFDVVDMLIKHHPKDCLMEVNGFGNTPLHHAVSTSPGLPYRPTGVTHAEYVQRFLQACPEAALVTNCQGQLPLHLAMESAEGGQAHLDVVRCLIECYPASIRMPDADGRLALHHLSAMSIRHVSEKRWRRSRRPRARTQTPSFPAYVTIRDSRLDTNQQSASSARVLPRPSIALD